MTPQSRSEWMGLLARSGIEALRDAWGVLNLSPEFEWLRAPETGAVMVRGRAGGSGKPFNLGEMTVTRCALRLLDDGVIGHAYVQGAIVLMPSAQRLRMRSCRPGTPRSCSGL